jgi:DNA repair exonuclease SbcCD nuclease subunit
MRILAIGDPHFHVDNITESKQFTSSIDTYLTNNNVDCIVVLGDILHTHEKLHTDALNSALSFFKMLISHNKHVFCLVGNHDATSNTIFLTQNHWLNVLKGWDGLTIVDYPIIYENLTLCPYVPEGRFIEALSVLNDDWKKCNIVFAHQTLNGAKMGPIISSNVEEWLDEYPLLISGHMHDKQKVKKNLYYTGSSMQHSFGEGDDKSIALITVEDGEVDIEEVYLTIKRKKILYTTIEELSSVQEKINENPEIEFKIVIKGDDNDLKAIKKSNLYKETLNLDNVKDIKLKAEVKDDGKIKILEDDFVECLQSLIYNEENPYLSSLYEHVMYGKEDKSDKDILFF